MHRQIGRSGEERRGEERRGEERRQTGRQARFCKRLFYLKKNHKIRNTIFAVTREASVRETLRVENRREGRVG